MTLVTFDPVEGLQRLQAELDRFFGKPMFDLGLSGPNVYPPINVFTDKDAILIRAEVPGVPPDQLNVQIEGGRLTITGQRPVPQSVEGSHHRRERRFGSFSRTVQLPRDLDPEQAAADVKHGVLTVRIPRHAAARPRQIEVRAA